MNLIITTFPQRLEFERACASLNALGRSYEVLSPDPAFALVGAPCIIAEAAARAALAEAGKEDFVCSGWVDYTPPTLSVPGEPPARYAEDVFGMARIMVLAPCVADLARIRITAHITGSLAETFPFLNSDLREGCFTSGGPTFTFAERYRMICLYPRRITVAKADDIVDAWRVLEVIRRRVNEVWARRHELEPSYEMRERPPALEIFKRLPKINCQQCGELTCLAFAARLWRGQTSVARCRPVFEGDWRHLEGALREICAGLGVAAEPDEAAGARSG
jgi:ArsR family metal-binding transcriptional regulator